MAKLRKKNGKARYFELLIDPGADYTLISQYDAQLLGFKYKAIKQKEIKVEVANLAFYLRKENFSDFNHRRSWLCRSGIGC